MSATEESNTTLTKDDFDGIEPWLQRAALTGKSEDTVKSYSAFTEARRRYVDKKPTWTTWTPEDYGPVWTAGAALLKQAKAEYDLATTRLLRAVRETRLSMDDHGLGGLSRKLQASCTTTTGSEFDQVTRLWESTLTTNGADLIDAFDALFRCILPNETLVESLGQGLEMISKAGGDLSAAHVKQAWTQIAPVWHDTTSSLEAHLGPFMDKIATAIESEEKEARGLYE